MLILDKERDYDSYKESMVGAQHFIDEISRIILGFRNHIEDYVVQSRNFAIYTMIT
jgi:hypothetical protein